MIDRTATIEEIAARYLKSSLTIMVGGFGRGGVPFSILEWMADHSEELRDLTLIKNDANEPHLGIGPILAKGMVRKLIATHIGLNPDFIAQLNRGDVESVLMPQGIFAECIRAGGAGIPALLSDIGIGTELAEGKQTIVLDGKSYLVERALRGDLALLCADRVDRIGNAWWKGSNRNMNVVMASACDRVVVEAKEIVEVGEIEPENVHLPSVFVDAVVQALPRRHMQTTESAS